MKKSAPIFSLILLLIITLVIYEVKFSSGDIFEKEEFEEEEEDGPDTRPNEWAWLQRTYPYFEADPRATIDAIKEAKSLRENRSLEKSNSSNWEFAGPINIGGRVVDIEFNPQNPNIVYAGAATGGVLKSTDHGVTWIPIFDDQSNLSIGDIGIDPVNPDIIYVGTGEANGGHNNFPGGGIFKSTDAGETWTHIGLDLTAAIGRITVNPQNNNIVYAAAVGSYFKPNPERGVYKTTDGGNNWEKVFFISDSTGAIDLVMHPENPETLFVAMWERVRGAYVAHLNGPTSGIYRTFDGFATPPVELDESHGLPNTSLVTTGRIGLTISESDPNTLYALYNDGTDYVGLYRTDNLGETWSEADENKVIQVGTGGFSWYFGQVRVHPTNPDIVYALDVWLMKSLDGGNNWSTNIATGVHVDFHALAFDPNNSNYIIAGHDGGINISTNGGSFWLSQAQLPVTQFYEIGLDFQNPHRVYGGTQDNGTIRTMGGLLNDWDRIYGGDGFYVIVDPTDSDIMYAEYQRGVLSKSTNGGTHWTSATSGISVDESKNWSTPVVMDPNNNQVLYYGTNRLYKTVNGAESWYPISPDLTTEDPSALVGTITTISIAKTDSQYIYVGTDDGNVQATYDGGTTWQLLSNDLPVRWVTRVIVDPTDKNIVYVTLSGLKWREPQPHVFKSTDAGETWANISGNLPDAPVNAIAIDLIDHNIVYIGNDVGVYYTKNGVNWSALGQGLPIVPANDMKIHPTENYLAVGTHARGIYKIDLNPISGNETPAGLPEDFVLSQNYPNPFNPTTTIRYHIARRSEWHSDLHVTLKVYDILGEETTLLVNGKKQPGDYEVVFDAAGLSSGVYFYVLEVAGASKFRETKKMILMK